LIAPLVEFFITKPRSAGWTVWSSYLYHRVYGTW